MFFLTDNPMIGETTKSGQRFQHDAFIIKEKPDARIQNLPDAGACRYVYHHRAMLSGSSGAETPRLSPQSVPEWDVSRRGT
jgi:hypothetical protein